MLIDEVYISVKAGNGGDGVVHFYHDRHTPKGGPDGGDGGDGGSVFFQAVSDINRLSQFRHEKEFSAQNGHSGTVNKKSGKNGQDLILKVPIGTIINYDNGTSIELDTLDEMIMIAKGGKGGVGNFRFRSATNQQPKESKPGEIKELKNLFLKLKLIAHIGLIGLPNAGKTSLLNELTSANAKVANYAFTTLEPNLGVSKSGLIIADIPGLIEGASGGKGLGYKFLKHIERTKLLIHCISAESSDFKKDYQAIRHELANYSQELISKPEIIVVTKIDLINEDKIKEIKKTIKPQLFTSIIDSQSLEKLEQLISKQLLS